MAERVSEAELVRFVEGELPSRRARQIEAMLAADSELRERVEAMRADLASQDEFREAMQGGAGIEVERRIESSLVGSVTSVLEQNDNDKGV